MKVALITTPPEVRSGIGDYTRHLLPYLREHCDLEVFAEEAGGFGDEAVRPVSDMAPREYDQILYQLGNEQSHAFMPPMIRALGGTVMQHDWVLFDMAVSAWPALLRGGAKGLGIALREGGLEQARIYARNIFERRRQRNRPVTHVDTSSLEGSVLAGWYEPEEGGRWAADAASLRIPSPSVRSVRIVLHAEGDRRVRILQGGSVLSEGGGGEHELAPDDGEQPELVLETQGVRVTREQRRHGDPRRMGCFVQRVRWVDAEGEHELDLGAPAAAPPRMVTLSSDRFRLPLNRSVVRFADAFLVHSRYVAERIRSDRNAPTPIGLVHHGSEFRWRDEDRRAARQKLGLPAEWVDSFLITSFGGVQPHKRIDKALRALALARKERPDIRMVLAGSVHSAEFDPRAEARRLSLEDAVRFTGYVQEEEGWEWLHAGDVALNLRGPTSGGTSGGIFQAFSVGRPVLVSDAGEQRELPDACVLKTPLGEREIESIAEVLVALRDDPERRRDLEAAVRVFVEEECHWGIVARRYAEHMESFPRPRISRRKLIALRSRSHSG